MRFVLCLALASCADTRREPVDVPPAPLLAKPTVEVATIELVGGRWDFRAGARMEDDRIALSYCCTAFGIATSRLPALSPGWWLLAVDHTNSECNRGAHVFVRGAASADALQSSRGQTVLDAPARSGGGISTLTFEVTDAAPLELQIVTEGGLRCCGTTTISGIVAHKRPAPSVAGSGDGRERDAYEALMKWSWNKGLGDPIPAATGCAGR